MKRIFNLSVAALALCLLLCPLSCRNRNKKNNIMENNPLDGPVVEMTTSFGTMRIKLYNATPKHRDNFLKLAGAGFYDSLRFHRVISGFMIQGGDPLSRDTSLRTRWGTGGPDYTVPAEFVPELKHTKGALAAARLGDTANPLRASSGSQFYIVQSESGCAHLDGQYTVFGQVVDGMDVIDKIAYVATDPYDRPLTDVLIEKVCLPVPEGRAADENSDSVAVSDSSDAGVRGEDAPDAGGATER